MEILMLCPPILWPTLGAHSAGVPCRRRPSQRSNRKCLGCARLLLTALPLKHLSLLPTPLRLLLLTLEPFPELGYFCLLLLNHLLNDLSVFSKPANHDLFLCQFKISVSSACLQHTAPIAKLHLQLMAEGVYPSYQRLLGQAP